VTTALTSTPSTLDPTSWIDHPSGFLALSCRNQLFGIPNHPGLISYRDQGKHRVLFGGVHAPAEAREPLLRAFLADCLAARRRPLAVQVRAPQVQLFADLGFTVNRLGASYGLPITEHRLSGGARVKLRQKVRRAERLGLQVFELGVDLPRDAQAFARLDDLSAAWLADKGKPELDFMIGELGAPTERRRRVFVAVDADGEWVGFITYVPAWGQRPGFLHDLTRRRPDAPPGALELCNHVALERFREEGVEFLHFGFTPFICGPEPELACASGVVRWVIDLLARRGRLVYPAQDQVRYKRKWAPSVVESEWIAFRPVSLRAIYDLLRVTRSLAMRGPVRARQPTLGVSPGGPARRPRLSQYVPWPRESRDRTRNINRGTGNQNLE
jgi:lysylphosphatidylglycerol synthetase-like protein (DUF2156 family)